MAFNPLALGKLSKLWEQFNTAHPRVMPYFKAVSNGYIGEGSVLELNVVSPEGESLKCNIKLSAQDIELMKQLAQLAK